MNPSSYESIVEYLEIASRGMWRAPAGSDTIMFNAEIAYKWRQPCDPAGSDFRIGV
jgi:hypothetical protein